MKKFFFKRKHILCLIALTLSILCVKLCINIRFDQAVEQRRACSSVAEFVQTYQANKKFTLDFEHVLDEVRLFVDTKAKSMGNTDLWLDRTMPDQYWFNVDTFVLSDDYKSSNQFFPYVEKFVFPSDAHIAVWGDLHGSVSTVVESLVQLQRDGYLDEQFTITRKDFYCVFLGDFVDKEQHGTELLYLLMKLHNQNPGHVFLLRGNHEDAAVNKTFRKELSKKYPDIDPVTSKKIFCLYDHLPVALFGGIRSTDGLVNGIQFCHAGFEHGYNASTFLDSSAHFELITKLKRSSILEQLPDSQSKEQLIKLKDLVLRASSGQEKNLENSLLQEAKMEQHVINGHNWFTIQMLTWLYKREIINALPTLFQDLDLKSTMNLGDIRLGFSWNSFTDQENNKRLGGRDDLHVLWSYAHFNCGPEATNYFLRLNSTDTWTLQTVIRGHQHQGKMLEDLHQSEGLARWFDGKLVTTVASPLLTGYASFFIFHGAPDTADWSIDRYAAVSRFPFKKESSSLFS